MNEKDYSTLRGKKFLDLAFDRCIKCSTCKYAFDTFDKSCPSGEKFMFESYWASGRIRIARGLIRGDLEWNKGVIDPIFTCTTCGACMDSCQAPHADSIVDIIEALRALTVRHVGPGPSQDKLQSRCASEFNPYGAHHATNAELKASHALPDKADWVYFIGCTSNYRQTSLRDATLSFFKKIKLDFTLIDEHCCSSPLIRTGQVDGVEELMKYNLDKIREAGASRVVTSCAG
nr:(Fe-S)-binding protein [Candidatus Sigynarchaeota archaeon]